MKRAVGEGHNRVPGVFVPLGSVVATAQRLGKVREAVPLLEEGMRDRKSWANMSYVHAAPVRNLSWPDKCVSWVAGVAVTHQRDRARSELRILHALVESFRMLCDSSKTMRSKCSTANRHWLRRILPYVVSTTSPVMSTRWPWTNEHSRSVLLRISACHCVNRLVLVTTSVFGSRRASSKARTITVFPRPNWEQRNPPYRSGNAVRRNKFNNGEK